jgi:hypothetical protein
MELDEFSRFGKTPLIIFENEETFGRWKPLSLLLHRPDDEFIGIFQVTSAVEGKPHNISNAIYGTSLLDWVLIAFNNVRDPFGWPRAGDVIEYPLEEILFPELL